MTGHVEPTAQIRVSDGERHVFYDLTRPVAMAPCDHWTTPDKLAEDDPELPSCPICWLFLGSAGQ